MTGEQLYRAHRGTAIDLGMVPVLLPWSELTAADQHGWDVRAFEQSLRDRQPPKEIPYDGPYS